MEKTQLKKKATKANEPNKQIGKNGKPKID